MLYKQGKYNEALELPEKSRELRQRYEHLLFLWIQEVKDAIAKQRQKNDSIN